MLAAPNQDFNPRSREGSDYDDATPDDELVISIHAPVKGATRADRDICLIPRISIHAPVKGATSIRQLAVCLELDFNPRSREGSDIVQRVRAVQCIISIHAPVKGATEPKSQFTRISNISIHAPVKGATILHG